MGKLKAPFYRIVAIDSKKARDGEYIEQLGTYDPANKVAEKQLKIDAELAKKWLKTGAQPTDTVRSLLYKAGVITEKKTFVKKAEAPAKPAEEKKE
jgi:ribosomal protein S16